MTVDWVSLAILAVAYVVTRFSKLSIRQQNLVNAVSMFGIVGWRATQSLQGPNGLITLGAAVLGVVYLVRAWRVQG